MPVRVRPPVPNIMKHHREKRPWGYYEILLDDESCKGTRIVVNPGARLSLQYHNHRSEVWTIISGTALYTINGVSQEAKHGQSIKIIQGAHHRVQNEEGDPLVFIEVQYGTYFGEDDIVRLEDDYDRLENS